MLLLGDPAPYVHCITILFGSVCYLWTSWSIFFLIPWACFSSFSLGTGHPCARKCAYWFIAAFGIFTSREAWEQPERYCTFNCLYLPLTDFTHQLQMLKDPICMERVSSNAAFKLTYCLFFSVSVEITKLNQAPVFLILPSRQCCLSETVHVAIHVCAPAFHRRNTAVYTLGEG